MTVAAAAFVTPPTVRSPLAMFTTSSLSVVRASVGTSGATSSQPAAGPWLTPMPSASCVTDGSGSTWPKPIEWAPPRIASRCSSSVTPSSLRKTPYAGPVAGARSYVAIQSPGLGPATMLVGLARRSGSSTRTSPEFSSPGGIGVPSE